MCPRHRSPQASGAVVRFPIKEREEWQYHWHRWFAWRPVYLSDAREKAWLEFVWRRVEYDSTVEYVANRESPEDTQ